MRPKSKTDKQHSRWQKHLEGEITPKERSWLWRIAVKLVKISENGNHKFQPGPDSRQKSGKYPPSLTALLCTDTILKQE